MVRVQQTKAGQYFISLPLEKVAQAGLKKGDQLSVDYDRRTGELILAKVSQQ